MHAGWCWLEDHCVLTVRIGEDEEEFPSYYRGRQDA